MRGGGSPSGTPAARLPWGLARVAGQSMTPTLAPGDLLLVRYAAAPRPGHVVLARFPDGTVAVKRATGPRTTLTGGAGWWLASDNPDIGVDSRHRGPIAADSVLAVARARVWPRPRLLRPT
jgi:signal peptidase I